jgi:cobyrinic acid a,c-diamide synthase
MGKKKNKPKIYPEIFADALEDNESMMGEMAAMSVTCEQFGIDEETGYDLLMECSE